MTKQEVKIIDDASDVSDDGKEVDPVVEIKEVYSLKGNLRNSKVEFSLPSAANYSIDSKLFMGVEIPAPAKEILENFWKGVALALGSLTSVTNSEKASDNLKKELSRQNFQEHFVSGDATISYTKGTDNILELTLDGKAVLGMLESVSYSGEDSDEEGELINWGDDDNESVVES